MSLINRMLDDLAARQAPGTESLQGVRLNEPLRAATRGLGRGTLVVLALVTAAVAALGAWLWPGRVAIPVPQARPALAPAAPAAAPPAVAVPDAETPPTRETTGPRLLLAPRLASLDAAGTPLPAPGAVAEAEAAAPVERPPTRAAARPRAPALASPPRSGVAPAAPADAIDPAVERKQRAREALADQDPAAALAIVSPADAARDVEAAALRAAALQRLGRHGEAADAYAALTARDPGEPGHWVGLGISLEGERRREPARMAYRRALQSDRLAPSLRAFAQDRATVLETP